MGTTQSSRPRAASSVTAAVLAVAVSIGWAAVAIGSVADSASLINSAGESDSGLVGLFGTGFGAIGVVFGAVMLALAAWGIAIGVVEWERRPWIRIPGIATFATYGALAALYLLTTLSSDTGVEADRIALALVSVVADFGVVLLLAMRTSADDVAPRPGLSSSSRGRSSY